ncbi:MAG: hypothetical protein LUG95_08400 [Clostridiales bacterium]|nr:hypothetical protein [Clostridiales bacterium]
MLKNYIKKSLCCLLSTVMFFTGVQIGGVTAFANTKRTAQDIALNGSVSAYIESADNEYWISFEPSTSGYYEFVCSPVNSSGMILGSIYDASEEVLMMNACTAGNTDFIIAAELEVGETYYFVLETSDGTSYSTTVTVKAHSHTYTTTENYPAICDANDSQNNSDGANYTFCAYCSDYVTNAVYYYPANIKLSKTKYTYNGKKKTPSVTVKDRKGNVIPSTNYKVTYKK